MMYSYVDMFHVTSISRTKTEVLAVIFLNTTKKH